VEDQDLLSIEDNHKRFNAIVAAFEHRVYSLCLSLVQNQHDAEDITQDIFTLIYLKQESFKGDSKLSTWIYRIAINKCYEFLRFKSRKKRFGKLLSLSEELYDIAGDPSFSHPGTQLERKEQSDLLFQALASIPDRQRLVYTLHKVEGYDYPFIMETTGYSRSKIESLIFRAKQSLKEYLLKNYSKDDF
jgi:RNA polymerase sigma factor (sigma-70 family)